MVFARMGATGVGVGRPSSIPMPMFPTVPVATVGVYGRRCILDDFFARSMRSIGWIRWVACRAVARLRVGSLTAEWRR